MCLNYKLTNFNINIVVIKALKSENFDRTIDDDFLHDV